MKACDISRSPSRTSSLLSLLLWCWFSFLSSPPLFSFSSACAHYSTAVPSPRSPTPPRCICPDSLHFTQSLSFALSLQSSWRFKCQEMKERSPPPLPPVSFCHQCLWSLTHSSLQLCLLMVSLCANAFTHASLEELWSPPTFFCSITEPQGFDKASNALHKTCFFILSLLYRFYHKWFFFFVLCGFQSPVNKWSTTGRIRTRSKITIRRWKERVSLDFLFLRVDFIDGCEIQLFSIITVN